MDDYWSPEKGVPRLIQDQQQYDYDNDKMEREGKLEHAKGTVQKNYGDLKNQVKKATK